MLLIIMIIIGRSIPVDIIAGQLMLAGVTSTHKEVAHSALYAAPARRISTPCLHFSPNAANARVRFAAILARSQ